MNSFQRIMPFYDSYYILVFIILNNDPLGINLIAQMDAACGWSFQNFSEVFGGWGLQQPAIRERS
jgi:hypothetical protein